MKTLLSVLVCMFCLTLLCPLALADETDPSRLAILEQSKAEALTLLNQGEFQQAYELYIRLLREQPEDDAINLGLARSAAMAGHHYQAVMAYQRLIERYPNTPGLYSEIARSYIALGDRPTAEYYTQRLRELDKNLTQQDVDRALDALEKNYTNFHYYGKIRTGFIYDSNANQGPSSNIMNLGVWNNVIVPEAQGKESGAMYVGADIDLSWRMSQNSSWWVVSDAQFYWRGNFNHDLNSTHIRESQWGRIGVGVRHLSDKSMFDVRIKGEIFDYEFYQNISTIGPEATFVYAVSPNTHLILRGGINQRFYSKDKNRDGVYGWVGPYIRHYLGEQRHYILAGIRYTGGNADRTDYSYNGWEAMTSLTFKLPYRLELSPYVIYGEEYYNGPSTILEREDREDKRWRLGASLIWRINETWSVDLSYQYITNYSKSPLYDYNQNMVTVGVAWNF